MKMLLFHVVEERDRVTFTRTLSRRGYEISFKEGLETGAVCLSLDAARFVKWLLRKAEESTPPVATLFGSDGFDFLPDVSRPSSSLSLKFDSEEGLFLYFSQGEERWEFPISTRELEELATEVALYHQIDMAQLIKPKEAE